VKTRILALASCILGLAAFTASLGAEPSWLLEDQFERRHDLSHAIGAEASIVIVANAKDAAARLVAWKRALEASSLASVPVYLLCDLSGVPFFVPKATIVKRLRADHPDEALLLDWKGEAARRLATGKAQLIVQLYKNGRLAATVAGEADPQGLAALEQARR